MESYFSLARLLGSKDKKVSVKSPRKTISVLLLIDSRSMMTYGIGRSTVENV